MESPNELKNHYAKLKQVEDVVVAEYFDHPAIVFFVEPTWKYKLLFLFYETKKSQFLQDLKNTASEAIGDTMEWKVKLIL